MYILMMTYKTNDGMTYTYWEMDHDAEVLKELIRTNLEKLALNCTGPRIIKWIIFKSNEIVVCFPE